MSAKLYGLIGKKLEHSFSQKYFRQKFSDQGIDADYQLFELDSIEEFPELLKKNPSLVGLNVTIPYKSEVIPFLDELDPLAREVGAVNTIRIENGKTKGYNSDIHGFNASLNGFLPKDFNEDVLILGTGGSAKAVTFALKKFRDLRSIYYASRTPEGDRQFSYASLHPSVFRKFGLIINTTPLGMYPNVTSCPDLPFEGFSKSQLLYDLVYNPEETRFLKRGKWIGCTGKNGLEMLYAQAEKSWEFWNE